jgi:hypothetical protein
MTIINRRQEDILKELDQKGYVNVVDLCETHNVSTVTIRKDLNFFGKRKAFVTHAWRTASSPMLLKEMGDKEVLLRYGSYRFRSIKVYK